MPNSKRTENQSPLRRERAGAGKKKKFPVFTVALIACFVLIPAALFVAGLRNSESGLFARPTPTPVPEEIAATPTTGPTATPAPTPTPALPPAVKVQGIYFSLHNMQSGDIEHFINLTETTSLNSIVIDVKEDRGYFTFATDNEMLKAPADAWAAEFGSKRISADEITRMKELGIYTIARIVCFRDTFYAVQNPEAALQHVDGGAWRDNHGHRWLDPSNEDVREYIAEVCREAARLGFDEVQLDYVRYPTDGRTANIIYGEAGARDTRYNTINDFVAFIREEMRKYGVRTSADVFGIVGMSYTDAQTVGQNFQLLLGSLDSICPMIYPSHFANDRQNGVGQDIGPSGNVRRFTAPDLEPYEVIYHYLLQIKESQLDVFAENNPDVEMAIIRPYLQAFTAEYLASDYYIVYGPEEIRAQIQATFDAGFEEYILWRSWNNNYNAEAIP